LYVLKKVFLFIFIFFFCNQIIFSQVPDSLQIKLPETWLGTWQGQMILTYASGKSMEIEVGLEIKKMENQVRWNWKIIYDDSKNRQERAYELIAINSKLGKYAIDENNSIVLDAFFADNTLSSVFNVENNLIFTTYRLQGDTLYFENTMVKKDKPKITGGKEGNPKVDSFEVLVLQRGILKKK